MRHVTTSCGALRSGRVTHFLRADTNVSRKIVHWSSSQQAKPWEYRESDNGEITHSFVQTPAVSLISGPFNLCFHHFITFARFSIFQIILHFRENQSFVCAVSYFLPSWSSFGASQGRVLNIKTNISSRSEPNAEWSVAASKELHGRRNSKSYIIKRTANNGFVRHQESTRNLAPITLHLSLFPLLFFYLL